MADCVATCDAATVTTDGGRATSSLYQEEKGTFQSVTASFRQQMTGPFDTDHKALQRAVPVGRTEGRGAMLARRQSWCSRRGASWRKQASRRDDGAQRLSRTSEEALPATTGGEGNEGTLAFISKGGQAVRPW